MPKYKSVESVIEIKTKSFGMSAAIVINDETFQLSNWDKDKTSKRADNDDNDENRSCHFYNHGEHLHK